MESNVPKEKFANRSCRRDAAEIKTRRPGLCESPLVLGLVLLILMAVSAQLFSQAASPGNLRVGIDRIMEEPYQSWFKDRKIGLITNPTGVNSELNGTAEVFRKSGFTVTTLFGPEHGLTGEAQAGQEIEDRPRVYSLYGDHRAPTSEMLSSVDLLVYDIQDVGVRFYTFISTMFLSMEAAARENIPFVVLDRPNPISGNRVEGPILEAEFKSFVGIHPLPVRYGMTAGELATYLNASTGIKADLRVVPVKGWRRGEWYDETGLQWIPPSPNMPTLDTATLYPGTCLIEGTNLSEGRGTTRPFEFIGAPWLNNELLVDELNQLNLPGVLFRPQLFTPTFSKYEGESCRGLQIHVVDRNRFEPIPAILELISAVIRLHPDHFQFRAASFDRLAGNSWIRQMLSDGKPTGSILARWRTATDQFRVSRQEFLIYP